MSDPKICTECGAEFEPDGDWEICGACYKKFLKAWEAEENLRVPRWKSCRWCGELIPIHDICCEKCGEKV